MQDPCVPFSLPDDLSLGCATAPTQIEGGAIRHSWYDWSMQEGKIADGTDTRRANGHWNHVERDVNLMVSLGIREYRLGIEWCRIEPTEGNFSREAAQHYLDEILLLKENGIRPLVTLHHFTNPLWFENNGAFTRPDSPAVFLRYVEFIVSYLRDAVNEYVTINEPNVYAVNGYVFGSWPPGNKSIVSYFRVLKHLAYAHILTYDKIHEIYKDRPVLVGFANHLRVFEGYNRSAMNRFQAKFLALLFQDRMTDALMTGDFRFPIRGRSPLGRGKFYDFIGINYYTRSAVHRGKIDTFPGRPVNDLGWEIYPEGLGQLIAEQYAKYKAPVYITENGTCDKADQFRPRFLYDHLKAASETGIPVLRYYHWTLMDNFEWAEGESAPFGLCAYDFETGWITIRKSAEFYRAVIENRKVTEEMIREYL